MTFTHLDAAGQANMVDVMAKSVTHREARAAVTVQLLPETLTAILDGQLDKGDVFAVARIAGIQAAKRTAELIPLCHPLLISKIAVELTPIPATHSIYIESYCALDGKTGVEMEALTAASVTALTLYDMCKAIDPAITINDLHVLEKKGGKTGHWQHPDNQHNPT